MYRQQHLLILCASFSSGLCHQQASFDAASASSTYTGESFGHAAGQAIVPGAGYWCSSGAHTLGQVVTWTGMLDAQRSVSGINLNWAYAPGELKVLVSADGANFDEQQGWEQLTRGEMAYAHTVMFSAPVVVRAVALVMRLPRPWVYFGLNQAALLADPGPVMIVSGSSSVAGELCLVVAGAALSQDGAPIALKPCLSSIAAGDGADIFKFTPQGQVVNLASQMCVTLAPENP